MTTGHGDAAPGNAGGKPRKPKKKKEGVVARVKRQGRQAASLGSTLVHRPREFPHEAGGLMKQGFRTMWLARGGGFYAIGFVITFLYLEVRTIATEVGAASGFFDFLGEELLEFLFRFSIQSLANTVQAFLWPLLLVGEYEYAGVAVLVLGYLGFDRWCKPALTRWLFDEPEDGDGNAAAR